MGSDSFFSCPYDMLSHAHYLLDGIEKLAKLSEKEKKIMRHLGSAQTLLWTADLYTLGEIMSHNKPKPSEKDR